MQDCPFPLTSDIADYQHSFLIATVAPYSQKDAVQEEVNYLFPGKVTAAPLVEGFLERYIRS